MTQAEKKKLPRDERPANAKVSPKRQLPKAPGDETLPEHHERLHSIGGILDGMFGKLKDCPKELWDQRAFLMIVGLVYEKLSAKENRISLKEITTLGRILAEQRRSRTSGAHRPRRKKKSGAVSSELPEAFGQAVKRLYGTAAHVK